MDTLKNRIINNIARSLEDGQRKNLTLVERANLIFEDLHNNGIEFSFDDGSEKVHKTPEEELVNYYLNKDNVIGLILPSVYKVYVAVKMNFTDSNDLAEVIGVYTEKPLAEAACYRMVKKLGYPQPMEVFELTLNYDWDAKIVEVPDGTIIVDKPSLGRIIEG